MIQVSTQTHTHSQANVFQNARIMAAAALIFGCALVFMTGFASSETLHNAAHDTRHALAFPCH